MHLSPYLLGYDMNQEIVFGILGRFAEVQDGPCGELTIHV